MTEIERLREALTPSMSTKAAYICEFSFYRTISMGDGEDRAEQISVPWTTIKEIMAAILNRANDQQLQGGTSEKKPL